MSYREKGNGRPMIRKKTGQSVVDFVLAFIAVAVMALGITRIWVWFNLNYATKQASYERSRFFAGEPHTRETSSPPVDIGGVVNNYTQVYQPIYLTEEWVFRGNPEGSGFQGLGDGGYLSPEYTCKQANQTYWVNGTNYTTCGDVGTCGHDEANETNITLNTTPAIFNVTCPCFVSCQCLLKNKQLIDSLNQQIASICGKDKDCDACNYDSCELMDYDNSTAGYFTGNYTINENGTNLTNETQLPKADEGCGQVCLMLRNAKSMDDQAEKCDDWWETCSWGGGKHAAAQLRDGASKLRDSAGRLARRGKNYIARRDDIINCCNITNMTEQQECLKNAALNAFNCPYESDEMKTTWSSQMSTLQRQIDVFVNTTKSIEPPGILQWCPDMATYVAYYKASNTTGSICSSNATAYCNTASNTTNCKPDVYSAACDPAFYNCYWGVGNWQKESGVFPVIGLIVVPLHIPRDRVPTAIAGECSWTWQDRFSQGFGAWCCHSGPGECEKEYTRCDNNCPNNGGAYFSCCRANYPSAYTATLEAETQDCCQKRYITFDGKNWSPSGRNCSLPWGNCDGDPDANATDKCGLAYLAGVELFNMTTTLGNEYNKLRCDICHVNDCCGLAGNNETAAEVPQCVQDPVGYFNITPPCPVPPCP